MVCYALFFAQPTKVRRTPLTAGQLRFLYITALRVMRVSVVYVGMQRKPRCKASSPESRKLLFFASS